MKFCPPLPLWTLIKRTSVYICILFLLSSSCRTGSATTGPSETQNYTSPPTKKKKKHGNICHTIVESIARYEKLLYGCWASKLETLAGLFRPSADRSLLELSGSSQACFRKVSRGVVCQRLSGLPFTGFSLRSVSRQDSSSEDAMEGWQKPGGRKTS